MKLPIYLDYSSTTPVDLRVAEKMMQHLTINTIFGNPASRDHRYGWEAEESVDVSRHYIADLIGADSREIIFTSGATESDNLALKGAAHANCGKGRHIITSVTEHKAVLDSCLQLEKEGFIVTRLTPSSNGIITPQKLSDALREDTILVSLMHVNNETGVIQDITEFGKICRLRGILFHVDATQSVGKLSIDLKTLPVDLMSFSAHKLYGPKGIGALFVRRMPQVLIEPQIHGGQNERGMRSGTLPVHQIVGMGEAYRLAGELFASEIPRLQSMRDFFWKEIREIEGVTVNGIFDQSVSNVINISFNDVDGESLMIALKDLAVSRGSACTSAVLQPSYVLRAMGVKEEVAHSSIRFSIGRFTTHEEIEFAVSVVKTAIVQLRDIGY
ncbi:cysteine desulfurase family protein [secondary endosymbiont of Heteropsylla cubana]|uniref:cysteine desulfurase n=1 Tax=secondary endosymbiont of Heteropsylla cubana TaxID=134287 RepID=J7GT33_9ENTR|nr:IscS subfamily cysteine desulfurase [secondary endosymbiont of Heteropsylla cubana]AFP85897.1 cysteine desulfurase family protein [secondary endosymbiont of Heteropsylla cubana]